MSLPAPASGVAIPAHTGGEATLIAQIRQAVQAAATCPLVARQMSDSGRAAIAFDYRDGAVVSDPVVSRSSGFGLLDRAALKAVRSAHYPAAPPETAASVLHLLVWVDEACEG